MIRLMAFILVISMSGMVFAADPAPTIERTLNGGLTFLTKQQNRDGSFGNDKARLLSTSRALLVFLQVGNVPDSGKYGFAVKAAEDWMVRSVLPSGGFVESDGRTRNQAAAVLALAETYGAESNPERRGRVLAALRLAVGPLLAMQVPVQVPVRADAGGWGEEKNAPASVQMTAIAAIALSSARDLGVAVPATVFEQARRYLLACGDGASGGFLSEPGKPATLDSTSAALMALDVMYPSGDDTERALPAAAKYMDSQSAAAKSMGFMAGAWVCWCDARLEIPAALKIRDAYVQRLIAAQDKDGAWNALSANTTATGPIRLVVTELALISLTAHFRSMPVLRR